MVSADTDQIMLTIYICYNLQRKANKSQRQFICEEIVKILTIVQQGIYWQLDISIPPDLKVTKC